jgi:hypothetical protein
MKGIKNNLEKIQAETTNPHLYGYEISLEDGYFIHPYYDVWKEQEKIGNLIQNLDISEEKLNELYKYSRNKFFSNSFAALQSKSKRQCKEFAGQNDFAYYVCAMQKPYRHVPMVEIIMIILLIILLIKINHVQL